MPSMSAVLKVGFTLRKRRLLFISRKYLRNEDINISPSFTAKLKRYSHGRFSTV